MVGEAPYPGAQEPGMTLAAAAYRRNSAGPGRVQFFAAATRPAEKKSSAEKPRESGPTLQLRTGPILTRFSSADRGTSQPSEPINASLIPAPTHRQHPLFPRKGQNGRPISIS